MVLREYGVDDGYKGGLDEDDGKGSRAVPSRTYIGSRAAFIKEYPEYGRIRSFFFGLVQVPFWGYRCVLSVAQIMIMSADVPHTLYLGRDERGKGGSRAKTSKPEPFDPYKPIDPDDPSIRLNEESLRRARERRKKAAADMEPLNISEIIDSTQPA